VMRKRQGKGSVGVVVFLFGHLCRLVGRSQLRHTTSSTKHIGVPPQGGRDTSFLHILCLLIDYPIQTKLFAYASACT
jgi:hypothetical protein